MWKRIGESVKPGIAFLGLFLLLLASGGKAQELQTSVDKNPVPPGESFQYTITLKDAQGRIESPDFEGFPDFRGPSRSTQVRMVNGKVSRRITVKYKVRAPEEEGEYRIGPIRANTDKGELKGPAIELKVDTGAPTSGKKEKSASASSQPSGNGRLIARIRSDRSKVYEGEEVLVTYELYSRYRNIKLAQRNFPSIDGAWTEEIDDDGNTGWQEGVERIDGKPYKKAILKKVLIYPQKSGELQIDPLELTCLVNRGFFSQGEKKKVKSNSPVLQVEPLPEGAPESFKGAVGDYELQASLDRNKAKTDASVNLRVKIEGKGNLKLVEGPDPGIPPDIEHYDPNVDRRMNVGAQGIYGSKEWEYLIIPRQSGTYEIGPIEFSYFHPEKEEYRTLSSGPYELQVQKGKGEEESPVTDPGRGKEKVELLEEELRYIRTDLDDLVPKGAEDRKGYRDIALLTPPFLGAIIFLILGRRKEGGGGTLKRARRSARKRLKDAEKALKKGDRAVFHEELYKALHEYFSDRLQLPQAELSKEGIEKGLRKKGVPEAMIERSMRTLQNSDMMRYAPSQNVSDQEIHSETVELLAELENYLK